MHPEPIDLFHQGHDRGIAVYLLDTPGGPALFDCGPASCIPQLERGLAERGLELADLRHLLLSHIHLDHAGAAGTLVRRHPGLQVHVSSIGAPHLVDPSRLERSARRLYGDALDRLWGELTPLPAASLREVGDRVLGLEAFPSPGHAAHHVSYLDPEGTLYDGDAVGLRIPPHRYALPVAPPPDVDVDAWERTFDEIERRAPERLALVHFGVVTEAGDHLLRARAALRERAEWVRAGLSEEEFAQRSAQVLIEEEGEAAVDLYQLTGGFESSFVGLRRYWDKRAEAEAAAAS
jgi:glyoxylase-like metal-dependent hydrolase (beta-lactamase superfamily II)